MPGEISIVTTGESSLVALTGKISIAAHHAISITAIIASFPFVVMDLDYTQVGAPKALILI